MSTLIENQKSMPIPSQMFNFLTVINDSGKDIYVEAMHNNLGAPLIIIRGSPAAKSEDKDDLKSDDIIIKDPTQAEKEKKAPK